jgi:hypothetical protein
MYRPKKNETQNLDKRTKLSLWDVPSGIVKIIGMWVERTELLSFIIKKGMESLISILITRNPNLSQSLDKKKWLYIERTYHP